MLFFGFVVSWSICSTPLPLALLNFVVTLFSMYGLGIVFSSLFLYHGRDAWRTADLVMEPTNVLSGSYFPARFLGVGLLGIAALIPTTLGLDALRQLLVPSFAPRVLDWRWESLILVALGLVFALIASWALR